MARKTHPGSIRRRGSSYQVRLDVNGETHTFTLKGVTRAAAEDAATKEYKKLMGRAQRTKHGLPGAVPFSELLERFEEDYVPALAPNTRAAYGDSLKPLRAYFVKKLGDPVIDQVHAAHVRAFLTWRRVHGAAGKPRKRPLSNRTLEKDRAVLHRIFGLADELELRDGNPVARVEPPKYDERDPVILGPGQYERLLTEAEGHLPFHVYVLTLGETGVRCESEALWLRWEDVDLSAGFLWIASGRGGHRTKSGKGRWVPMTPRLREAMRAHFARYRFASYDGQPSEWVFHHVDGLRRGRAQPGARVKSFRDRFDSARKRAKLPEGFVAHDLRHRRVTTWLADGGDVVKVKEAMGHSDLRVTMRYTHLTRDHLKSLVEEGGFQATNLGTGSDGG